MGRKLRTVRLLPEVEPSVCLEPKVAKTLFAALSQMAVY